MKLYLEIQIAERAFEVWGGEEALEQEKERREKKREDIKKKKFDKKITGYCKNIFFPYLLLISSFFFVLELKRAVRSSLYKKIDTTHEHEFDEEVYNEEKDEYTKSCKTCSHKLTYEKM